MKPNIFLSVAIILLPALIVGCACNQPSLLQTSFKPQSVDSSVYRAKVDNFMVVLDASGSMGYCYRDSNRLNTATAIVGSINRSLPALNIQGALRSFGHSPAVSANDTALLFGLAAYTQSGFQAGLNKVTAADGNSPMTEALTAAGEDLASTKGKIALILVSDGEGMGKETEAAAQGLKDRFGARLCIYTIHVGDNAAGASVLARLVEIGGCGFATGDSDLASSAGIFDFVEDVFLEKRVDADKDGVYDDQDSCPNTPPKVKVDTRGCPLDSDGDGVFDSSDQCPGTAAGVKVDASGCPLDSDGDGVADYSDKCPNTPAYTQVDASGCPLDSDGDGVADYSDKCPNTRRGAPVDARGCPLDSDGDGVADYMDNCPGTPGGTAVDYSGCPLVSATKSAKLTDAGTWLYEDIKFDSGSSKIKASSYSVLDEIAAFMKANPGMKAEVQGHTDSVGKADANMRLSKSRAQAVVTYLVGNGIPADRLTAEGYGESRPMTSNDSAEGRAKNRRVELKPIR